MYGNMRTPFAPSLATADMHSQRTVLPNGPVANYHYPNYHLYNVPTGHHQAVVSAALARQYAAMAPEGHHGDYRPHTDRDYTPDSEDVLRRRCSGERRGSGARRGSGSMPADTGQGQTKKQQRFDILRKLGSGTYGKVSLAMDHKAGEEVAIKVIRKSAIPNTSDLIRIRREIRIMSALKHPNIIEIKEVFENNEKIILVMEYASGGELYDFVGKHGPLPEDEVRRLFRQIVSAVYYCHMHGVAHRDLKLENILLDKNLGAKIADFGLSNYFTDHVLLRTFCGSPLYASPEIINGTPYKGPEVDCWSLGVLLYTLAYSSMPFDGRDFNRMARQIKRGAYYEPDPPSSASMLIRSMLRVTPERRATISEIAVHWWLNFDETGSSISDLPENQVLDSTPLYVRQETMMIQSFGEENEMFAEFNHLSEVTRKKIEEFRRRRRDAEWYLVECQTPLKKHSKKRSSSIVNDQQRQSSQALMQGQKRSRESSVAASGADVTARKDSNSEASRRTPARGHFTAAEIAAGEAGGVPDDQLLDTLSDPLSRLKALESRLHLHQLKDKSPTKQGAKMEDAAMPEEAPSRKMSEESGSKRPSSLALDKRAQKLEQASAASTPKKQKPATLKMSVDDLVHEKRALDVAVDNATAASLASAVLEDANRLVNQLMEEAMKGNVPAELIEKIHSSDAYRTEPFVKEILESVLSAQQSKPALSTPGTPTAPRAKPKSKQSSLSRVSKSGSSATGTPLPDVVNPEGEKSKMKGATPPPDVVAVGDVAPPPITKAQTPPVATATISVSPMKLIYSYQPVPEDAELLLSTPTSRPEVDEELKTSGNPVTAEPEEDICSTDFEDLGSEEDEDEAVKETKGDESPSSAAASFASTHSQPGELPDSQAFVPADANAAGEDEDNPFLRGLSKRLSRGKYERSKFTYARGVSIDESPRSSRKRMEEEKMKQAGQGSLEECPDEKVGDETEAKTDGQNSPQRRRHSDGDKNHLHPLDEAGGWTKKSDSDLGSNQDVDSPADGTNGDKEGQNGKTNSADVAESKGSKDAQSTKNTTVKAETGTDVINDSKKRRQERAKLKKVLRKENSADTGAGLAKQKPDPLEPASGDKKGVISGNDNTHKQQPLTEANAKNGDCSIDQTSVEKTEAAKDATHSAAPKGKEGAKSRKTGKKISRRKSCATEAAPKLEQDGAAEEASNRRASAAEPELRKTEVEENEDESKQKAICNEQSPIDQSIVSQSEQRRNSYRTSIGSSGGRSQDGEGDPSSKHLLSGTDYHPSSTTRSSKYQHLKSGGVAVADPLWLQYAREETQRVHQQASPYHHGYGIGDFKSSLDYGNDRPDDDYHSGKSHVPQSLSYRVGGTYSPRDTSPSRIGVGPSFRSQVDPLDAAAHAYHSSLDTQPASAALHSRGRKPRYQPSNDESFNDIGTKRYNPSSVVSGYTPTYTRRTTGSGDYYKTLYDDNLVYRRGSHYDPQPEEDWKGSGDKGSSGQFRVFQPKGLMKRRSRSLDKVNSRISLQDGEEQDAPYSSHHDAGAYHYQPAVGGSNRYEPSIASSNLAARQPPIDAKSKTNLKSILKKQPTFDTTTGGYSRYGEPEGRKGSDGDPTRGSNFVDRIRRHFSTDKPSDTEFTSSSNYRPKNDIYTGVTDPVSYGDSSSLYSTDAADGKQGQRKRNYIPMSRRRTTEIRYGGGDTATAYGDEYGVTSKRPTSPIEKIKGYFGGTSKSGRDPAVPGGAPSAYHYSAAASPFSTYQSNPVSAVAAAGGANTNYTTGYRKPYQSSGHRVTSYIPASRYYHEDPPLY